MAIPARLASVVGATRRPKECSGLGTRQALAGLVSGNPVKKAPTPMPRCLIPFILATAVWVGVTGPARAEAMNCAERSSIVAKLSNYKEEAEAIGLNKDGTLLEVFVSPEGTWTVLLSSPQGQSCIAAIGEAWQLKITSQRPES